MTIPKNTKEKILKEALKLFSGSGFVGVTVRDIAKEVGIRESALYKHFKSKQDIYDSLMDAMISHYEHAAAAFQLPQGELADLAAEYGAGSLQTLQRVGTSAFLFWLKDEYAAPFRRMLTIEQFKHSGAGKTYHSFFIDEALKFQRELFTEMIQQGYLKPADPAALALQFYSPFFLLFSKYDGLPEKEEEALALLEKHVELFAAQYQICAE